MIFALSALLMTSALVLVLFVSRMVERPQAPRWLVAACHGNAMALLATLIFAAGLGGALQAAFEGGLHGLVPLALTLAAPFVLIALISRLTRSGAAADTGTPQPGGRRPLRTGAAPAAPARRRLDRAA